MIKKLVILVLVLLVSINVGFGISDAYRDIIRMTSDCIDTCNTMSIYDPGYPVCIRACWDADEEAKRLLAEEEASAEPDPVVSDPVDSGGSDSSDDSDFFDEEAQAEHERKMAEIQDDIDKIKAETSRIKAETAQLKRENDAVDDMNEKLKNGEYDKVEVDCKRIWDNRVDEIIQTVKDKYDETGKDYGRAALSRDNKLYSIQKYGGVLKCYDHVPVSAAEQNRRKVEKRAKEIEDEQSDKELGAFSDAVEKYKRDELDLKEVSCNSLTDPRIKEKLEVVKKEYAENGGDIGRPVLTPDEKLYIVQITNDEQNCLLYRGAGVVDIVPENREVRGSVKVGKGTVKILRDGLITPYNSEFEVRAGDSIKTDKEGIVGIVSKDGLIQLGEDSSMGFIGLEFDPVGDRRLKSPPDAPWAADPSSFKLEVDNEAFWNNLYEDILDFHVENAPNHLISCSKAVAGDVSSLVSCGADTAAFLYGGKAWFDKKIDEDFPPGIVLTPTVAITTTGTKFTVEVDENGSTTVNILEGNVIVTDLITRNSVEVGSSEQVFVSQSEGIEKEEVVEEVSAESVEEWWSEDIINEVRQEELDKELNNKYVIFGVIFVLAIPIIIIAVIVLFIMKLVRDNKNKKKK